MPTSEYHALPERVVFHFFEVAQDWTGRPLPPHERFKIELETRRNGLLIDFSGPHYGDPLPPTEAGPTPELWNYEVLEIFLAHGEHYSEIELGPGGHYLLLELRGERQIVAEHAPIRYQCSALNGRWLGTALIPWSVLPPAPWTGNAYAIHGEGSTRRYCCAFPAQSSQPDFHRLESFQPVSGAPV